MSYVSGFMLGASIGKALHSLLTAQKEEAGASAGMCAAAPSGMPAFACVSAVKGRRRYKAAALAGNKALARMLQEQLQRMPFVQRAECNALTGSILICASREQAFAVLENFFYTRLFSDRPGQGAESAVQGIKKKTESASAGAIYETTDMVSRFISEKTNDVFNLRSLIALVFIIRGIQKTVVLGQRPSGPQLIWWAAALLRGRG